MGSLILIFIAVVLMSTANWVIKTFGDVTYSQIMFHLYQPQFFEPRLVESWLKNSILKAVIFCLLLYVGYRLLKKFKPQALMRANPYRQYLAWTFLVGSIIFMLWRLNLGVIIEYAFKTHELKFSNFYEQNYVMPEKVKITFPEEKKNLIVIFAESMETGFMNPYYFGDNLMPELSNLAEKYLNFSDRDGIGGAFQFDGVNFTQGGLLAQFCGLPLKVPMIDRQDAFNPAGGLFDKAICLSDILSQHGYEQTFMLGTPANFSDTDGFLESHGRVKLLDQPHLTGVYESNLKRHVKDADIFEFAKKEIKTLAQTGKPFAFTVMTMDTHFGTDTFDKRVCQQRYPENERLKNVISCGDQQIANFVRWIQNQEFADKTVIAVLADHLMMKGNVWQEGNDRRVLNIFINPAKMPSTRAQRMFTTLDIYPTLVESLGAEIEGGRLGLGASLFSNQKTLLEKGFSLKKLEKKLSHPSKLYNYFLLGEKIETDK